MPSSTEANASRKTNSTAALHEAALSLTSTDGLLPKPHISDPSLYFNRELSWLAFNHRVLLEAARSDWPLLERIKFFAIFFSCFRIIM